MKSIGIIDIGSNSMRLVLVQVSEKGNFKIIDELKETVRLGEGMGESLEIRPEKIENCIKTLKLFKSVCESVKAHSIIAAATEAVRKASNQDHFISRVKAETGIEVMLLSGEDEAYYDYFGVVNSMDIRDALIMDIGGCSTELIWVKGRKIKECTSLPFGSLSLAQRFELTDIIKPENEAALINFLLEAYRNVPWLSKAKHSHLIGVGGTIRNLGKIHRKLKGCSFDIAHNYPMINSDIHEIYNLIRDKSLAQRKKIKGLSKDRADIFVGAAAAVFTLVDYCGVKDINVSGYGLREGLIYKYICERSEPIEDILDFSLRNVLMNHGLNLTHAQNVYTLSSKIYEKLKTFSNFNASTERILKTAAMLHDCGISIRYYDHHKHSFYLITNSEINGLSQKELLMGAYVAASHRKDEYTADILHYKDILTVDDVDIIKKLGVILRIAESLDRNMNMTVEDIICKTQDDSFVIKTISHEDPELEIIDALKSAPCFKKVFQRNLVIV